MAIHPQYADAILDGRKHVEFRKRSLAPNVATVIIYATAPVKRIVGEFCVGQTLVASPPELWEAAGAAGAIDIQSYAAYYTGSHTAVGIVINDARRYAQPVALAELTPQPAVPQSFTYVAADQLERIRELTDVGASSPIARLHACLSALLVAGLPRCTVISAVSRQVGDAEPLPASEEPAAAR